jgi:hypothetical protein
MPNLDTGYTIPSPLIAHPSYLLEGHIDSRLASTGRTAVTQPITYISMFKLNELFGVSGKVSTIVHSMVGRARK